MVFFFYSFFLHILINKRKKEHEGKKEERFKMAEILWLINQPIKISFFKKENFRKNIFNFNQRIFQMISLNKVTSIIE
jgi:hypothetical protein